VSSSLIIDRGLCATRIHADVIYITYGPRLLRKSAVATLFLVDGFCFHIVLHRIYLLGILCAACVNCY
jgi:hypothetical protein